MNFRYIVFLILLFALNTVEGQKATNIFRAESGQTSQLRACSNNAGSIQMGNFVGQSERDQINDTLFLCWLDRFYIDHNGDFDLSGDPDLSTQAGIGYAWYNGIPTVTGMDLSSIEADPQAYKPSGEMVVYVDQMNGDAMFENGFYSGSTTFNDYISGGAITQKYFAPITFDRRSGSQALYEGNPAGECVNARVDEAFTVVYLNPIKVKNIENQYQGNPQKVRFTLEGGMPEFDGSEYTEIIIQLKNKTNTKGIISGSGFTHGDQLVFTVPEYGLYQIIIRDGISCEVIEEINIQENIIPVFVLDSISGQPGEIKCITWSVKDFEGIQFIFGGIKFNPAVVDFSYYTALNFHNVEIGTVIGPDQISAQWVPLNPDLTTLPDGTEFVQICFEIVGEPGDCTPIYFNNTDAVFTDEFGGGDCAPNQEPGMICVDPPTGLYVRVDVCGSRNNQDEGTATFQIFGGTGPYNYVLRTSGMTVIESGSVSAGAGKVTLYDIPAGFNYTLTVTDALGNEVVEDVDIINIDELLTIDFINVKQPTCYGLSDGSINIAVSGSAVINPNDYSVKWSTGDFGVNSLTQLPNGNYSVTITEDFTGCEAEGFVNLNVPPLEVEFTILDTAFCADSGGGRIQALVTGGTPTMNGYTYKWKEGTNFLNENTWISNFEDISPGQVFFDVHDTYPYCKLVDTLDMPFLYEIEVDALQQNPLCNGEKNGNLSLKVKLGDYPNSDFSFFPIPPYFPSAENFSVIGNDSIFADSLGEGFIGIEITEINTGCQTVEYFSFQNPSLLQSSFTIENLGCDEGQLGSSTIRINGGDQPYLVTSDSGLPDVTIPVNFGTYTYTDLAQGFYYLTITDGNGCVKLDTFEIKGTDELLRIDSLVYESFECIPNAKTDIIAYASGTGSAIFYYWFDENGNVVLDSNPNDNKLQNVGAGKYFITISDPNGCETTDSLELFEPNLFTLDLAITEPECSGANGGTPGSICVNTTGGTPGFNYLWDDGTPPDKPCLDNIGEGTYLLQVTDINNCRVDTMITLNGPPPIDVDIINVEGLSCNDGQTFDGQLTVSASGGNNPTVNYSYLLSSGTGGFGQIHQANDLEGGENWVLVSFNTLSGNVCFADTIYFDVPVPEVLELDYTNLLVQDVSCNGDCNGIAIVSATGGNNIFYSYDWLETGDKGSAVSNLCAGTYHVEIRDANGCITTDSITVNQPDILTAYIDPDNTNDINCFGSNTGQIQILHEGGNMGGPFTYNWLNDVASGPLATELESGFYSVTVVDEKGCNDVVDITLVEQEPIVAEIAEPAPIECYGGSTCITVDSATGGSGPNYRFSINGGPAYSLDSCITVFASDQAYLVEIFDKDGCSFSTTLQIDQPNEIIVDLGDDIEVGLGEFALLNPSIDADHSIQVVEWFPVLESDFCSGTNCQQLEIHPNGDLTYLVTVYDSKGCVGTDEINVTVNTKRNVFVPNAFSPNGDGHNERFQVYTGSGVQKVNYFRIFDRWGNKMYEEENLDPNPTGVGSWDGTFNGKLLNPGVYVYLMEVEFIDDRVIIYRGSITLLR